MAWTVTISGSTFFFFCFVMAAAESEDELAADTLVMGLALFLTDFFFFFFPAPLFPSRAPGPADSGVPAAPTWSVEHTSSAVLEGDFFPAHVDHWSRPCSPPPWGKARRPRRVYGCTPLFCTLRQRQSAVCRLRPQSQVATAAAVVKNSEKLTAEGQVLWRWLGRLLVLRQQTLLVVFFCLQPTGKAAMLLLQFCYPPSRVN
mmetsp:Transcript_41951/g.87682  ORF Transcript_41951/g.87682 Transcript_41951/m.87682 type:complete len:202 (-) Transcript_41951:1624-2229(-)